MPMTCLKNCLVLEISEEEEEEEDVAYANAK